jgi:hypothetical protein
MENKKKVNKKLNLHGKVKDYMIKINAKIYLINVQINQQKLLKFKIRKFTKEDRCH